MKIRSITKDTSSDDVTFTDIREWYNANMHPDKLDLDDQDVYENIYHAGRWGAIFQFTEKGAQNFVKRGKPRSIDDIAALTSIFRPGPLAAKVDDMYVEAKADPNNVDYGHPLLKECLEKTYGCIIFQESLMQIGNKVGKLSLDDCDLLRKCITKRSMTGKSKAKEQAAMLEEKFIIGAKENGFTEEAAKKLFEKLEFFSGYGFNRSVAFTELITIFNVDCQKQLKLVSDIKENDIVMTRNEETKETEYTKVLALHDHGEQDIFEFTLETGEKVRCTMNHKFRTTQGQMLPAWKIIADKLDISVTNAGNE